MSRCIAYRIRGRHDDPAAKRLLFRLWLTPPDARTLPEAWRPGYRSVAAGTVRAASAAKPMTGRGGAFEQRQATALGMRLEPETNPISDRRERSRVRLAWAGRPESRAWDLIWEMADRVGFEPTIRF